MPTLSFQVSRTERTTVMSYFYEIRSTTDTILKRSGGFIDREAATVAAREDARRLRAVPKPPTVGRILVGQNTEKSERN